MSRTKSEIMAGVECEKSRFIDNNTVEYWKNGCRVVRLHLTDILTFKDNGEVVYNSGGWKTRTTKERMNEYGHADVNIYQEKSIWYVKCGWDWKAPAESVFYDGLTVDKNGKVLKPKKDDKRAKRLLKSIDRYCKKVAGLKELPLPNNGDCWNCLLFDQNNKAGEKSTSTEHLLSHLKEGYIHGSLIMNALKWVGYRDPGFIWHLDVRDSIVRAVRRYLKANLGIAG